LAYNYAKLRGRIVEKYGSGRELAKALGITHVTLSRKLCGKSDFTIDDIENICGLLDIDKNDIGVYFFTPKV